ncbi:MAG: site-specific DNA-methyltransferase [Planctomycetota bacterium]|nr:site-specific DNA-methyltransferase [Planctomycetota bacterium]
MSDLPDGSVHLVVTSPPYWQLKDYGGDGQIGFDHDYETYINHLNIVWKECWRTLHDGCRLCVNIGDQFARSAYYGRYKVIPIHSEIIRFCETLGFDFMGKIIWQKTTTTHTTGGASVMGSFPYPRNGVVKLDYEYILLFKKPGKGPEPTPEQKRGAAMSAEQWNTYFSGHWRFPGMRQDRHLAMFPEELPARLIRMFSYPGETVLDPFCGSGTTSRAAGKLGRNSIGYEINPEYLPLILEKLGANGIFAKPGIISKGRKLSDAELAARIADLPYRFADAHKLDKKVDARKLGYGSRIGAGDSGKREEWFTVRSILSPNLIRLSNDLVIRLTGIREDPSFRGAAIDFLKEKIQGKRVFLRHDAVAFDPENRPMAYLYLENRTFVNAHLLRTKYVLVDESFPSRYLRKFQAARYPDSRGKTVDGRREADGERMAAE